MNELKLTPEFAGYRLALTENYNRAESLKVYQGLLAKFMVNLDLAFYQQLIDETGKTVTLAVNKRSLAHYVWRHNRLADHSPEERTSEMLALYKIYHRFFHERSHDYYLFTTEMVYQLGLRGFYNREKIKINDFVKTVNDEAPLKGHFYKIKKDEKTVGYLLGTSACGNELLLNLNPRINKALKKSQIIAGIDTLDDGKFPFRDDVVLKGARIIKSIQASTKKARLSEEYSLKDCIKNKVEAQLGNPKEFVSLETKQEVGKSLALLFDESMIPKQTVSKELYKIFQRTLAGDESDIIKEYQNCKINAPRYIEAQYRHSKVIAERAEKCLEKGRTFIATENVHLHREGEAGIKNFLIAKGYSLKRI